MDISIPEWKKVADVKWGEHPLALFEKDNTFLMLLAEKRDDRTLGFACSSCKPFLVTGDYSKLDLVHFPSEVTILRNLNASSKTKQNHLLVFTKPTYVPFSTAAISAAAEQHTADLNSLDYFVKNLGKDVTLTSVVGDANPFALDSSLLFSFLSFIRTASKPAASPSLIGLDLKGEKVLCPISSTSLGLVVGGTKQQRLHALHVFAEDAMQQNANVIIFDTTNSFTGLSRPSSTELNEYVSFSMPGLAAGFPMRELIPGQNAFVSHSSFSTKAMLAPFGLVDTELEKYLEKGMQNAPSTLPDFSEIDTNQFTKLRLTRVAKLIQTSFQSVFGNSTPIIDQGHSLGKVLHINLSKCSPESSIFFCLGLVKQLEQNEKPLFIIFEQDAAEIKPLAELYVNKFIGSNTSVLCHSEHEDSVPFVKSADLFVEIISNDVAITQGGKPPQRVKLRPTYSACTEL